MSIGCVRSGKEALPVQVVTQIMAGTPAWVQGYLRSGKDGTECREPSRATKVTSRY